MELTTEQAFRHVIFSKGCAKKVGLDYSTISHYRATLNKKRNNAKFTIDQMEKIIINFGATKIQEAKWKL